jgi:hypothetical protein
MVVVVAVVVVVLNPKNIHLNLLNHHLVGGFNPSENMKVSWDDDIPNKTTIHINITHICWFHNRYT